MGIYISENDRIQSKVFGLSEHKCAICGKMFECGSEYIYKRYDRTGKKGVYFCSYTCKRRDEAIQESQKKKKLNDWRVR